MQKKRKLRSQLIRNTKTVFKNKNLFNIFILGIASGTPLVLIMSTLSVWFKEIGIDKTTIGLFALATTPYIVKFLWSPFIDGIKLPFLYKKLGLRKSWLFVSQILLAIAISLLAFSNPLKFLYLTAIFTVLVAFLSATQDIVIDAYRIESLPKHLQGFGATVLVYGYRIGMLFSGAGALLLSEHVPFPIVYFIIALTYLFFAYFTIKLPKPRSFKHEDPNSASSWIKTHLALPFLDFISRPRWLVVILFIILFKLGDAFAGIMTNPFLLELNFTKSDIAYYVKTFGLFATLIGSLIGGILCVKYSIRTNLLFAGIIQMATNLIFCIQAMVGNSKLMLSLTIGAENLSGGIGTVAFVAYLSRLCNVRFTATQYALLSSLAATARTGLSSSSGWFATHLSWVEFFILSTLIAIPGIIMIFFLKETKNKVLN